MNDEKQQNENRPDGPEEALYSRFLSAFRALVPEGTPVTVALSGGADSVALLLLSCRYRAENRLDLRAFHVNHGLRGAEADRDERFCRELCQNLGVPFGSGKVDVGAYAARTGRSVEESARILRYGALRRGAPEGVIATAHNADDLLETMLLRLGRGSGTAGLGGIPQKNGRIVRPLLGFSKEELSAFLEAKGERYVTDSSNLDGRYTRNALRRSAAKSVKEIFPAALEACLRTARNCREDDEFISGLLPAKAPDGAGLGKLPPPLLKRLILREYGAYFSFLAEEERPTLEEKHFEEILSVISRGVHGKSVSLPGRVRALYDARGLTFTPDKEKSAGYDLPVKEGRTALPGGKTLFCARDEKKFADFLSKSGNVHKTFIQTALDSATIQGELTVRSKRPGDRIRFGGMTRRVSELIRSKTPDTSERESYPVLCDRAGVLWVPGCPPREAPQVRGSEPGVSPGTGGARSGTLYFALIGGTEHEEI